MASDLAANLTSRAGERIRADIISGRIPSGAPLRVAALARELSVSMSVVREALTKLAGQGIVAASPNQGFRVAALSREDLLDLTAVRITLECAALAGSIANGDVQWEGDVVSAHHVLERTQMTDPGTGILCEEWIAAHAAFHDALSSGCGSPRLLAIVRPLRDSAEIYRQWAGTRARREGRDVNAEHRALMELATARKTEEAVAMLRTHIQRTTDLLIATREAPAALLSAD
jgi:DNA-binding GntR family transcriptional regulator